MTIENKSEIIEELKSNIELELKQSQIDLAEQSKAIDIDEEDVIESEDLSHSSEAKDVYMMIQEQIRLKESDINSLNRVEFSEKHNRVDFGSVFLSNEVCYVVGVDHKRFKNNNQEIMPISIESPFFKKVRGLEVGSEIEFNGEKVRIEALA